MTKRDPNKTARNKTIKQMKTELRDLLPFALKECSKIDEQELNAYIGHKIGDFIDLPNEVIKTPEEYVDCWIRGLQISKEKNENKSFITDMEDKNKKFFRKYVLLFLRRSYLKHYEELYKVRPDTKEAEIWFGVNDADYGLLVTPTYRTNDWENDVSEIRNVKFLYWSIGHVMKTGLCLKGRNQPIEFSKHEDLYNFLIMQVRLTKSKYQIELMDLYIDFLKNSKSPDKIPLLIPEMRFEKSLRKHKYRLDFLIINPFTMEKIGIEISPWSTHGQFKGKDKTLKQLNLEASESFEKEMAKVREYFKKYKIPILHFTDNDIVDMKNIFELMKKYLNSSTPPQQLQLHLFSEYFE